MKQILIIICIAVLAESCGKMSEYDRFAQMFPEKIEIKGTILMHDDDLLKNPTDLRVVDSLIIFLDPKSSSHLVAVEKKDLNKIYSFLPRGRGPKEYELIREIEIDNEKRICFFDFTSDNYIEIPISLDNKYIFPYFKANVKPSFGKVLNSCRLDSTLFSSGVFEAEGRFLISRIYNTELSESKEYLIGKYPANEYSNVSNPHKGMAYQTRLRKNSNAKAIVAYSLMGGEIQFFYKENDSIIQNNRYIVNLPDFESDTDPIGTGVTFTAESLVNFLDVCFKDDYVLALYSGKSYEESGYDAYTGNQIFIFTAKGTPKAHIFLDHSIRSLDLDAPNSLIYGITLTPFPKIIKFNFPKTDLF